MEQCPTGRGNLVVAFGALPVVRTVSPAILGVAAFGANKTVLPAQFGQIYPTGVIVGESLLEIEYGQALKHFFHGASVFFLKFTAIGAICQPPNSIN